MNGGGTLYEFTNGTLQVMHAFPAFPLDGAAPLGVVNGSNGLYGITRRGGQYGNGELYTTAGGYQVLYDFGPYRDGNAVSLAADQLGNLYGTDGVLRCSGLGEANVYQFSAPNWSPLTLYGFENTGSTLSHVSTDSQGNVYGTTDNSYEALQGNVFKLTCCWNYTDLHDFTGGPSDGSSPEASPVVDAQGNIYGTTSSGGAYGHGVVWEISP